MKNLLLIVFLIAATMQRFNVAVPQSPVPVHSYDSIAELATKGIPQAGAELHYTRGYYTPGDGGGGMFVATNTIINTNSGTRIAASQSQYAGWSYERVSSGSSVNVRWFGARGLGEDESGQIIDAYSSLPSNEGGELFFPTGDWKFNLVVTKPNITIRGESHIHAASHPGLINHFRPATNNMPLIQVGTDSGFVRGFLMREVTLDGDRNGSIGVFFAGGAFEAHLSDTSVNLFTNCLKIQGGENFPASLIFLSNVNGQPSDVIGARGICIVQASTYPKSYTTGVYADQMHWDGPSHFGYMFELDSAEATISDSYFDMASKHGFKISKTFSQNPKLYLNNVSLDSDNSTDVLLETHNTSRLFSDVVMGRFSIDGLWKLSDGTLLHPPPAAWPEYTSLSSPNVTGPLGFVDAGEKNFLGGIYTNHQISASSGNLFITTEGAVKVQSGSGIFQLSGRSEFGDAHLRFYDASHGRFALLSARNGDLSLAPDSAGYISLTTSKGVNVLRCSDIGEIIHDGAYDLWTGKGVPSLSGEFSARLYFDASLRRLCASMGGQAYSPIPTLASSDTLTNKRLTPRVETLTDAATVTPNCDGFDGGKMQKLSQSTTIENPIGKPTDFQRYILRIKSSLAQRVSWGSQFRNAASILTSGGGATDYFVFQWNADEVGWDLVQQSTRSRE